MCKTLKIICFCYLAAACSFPVAAQWDPEGILFKPLRANIIEPRIGAYFQSAPDKLRLDIGSAVDLYALKVIPATEIRFGADFFTFTRLRSSGNFKFPVETTDFFFGLNSSVAIPLESFVLSGRLRVAHISSHISDGYQGPVQPFTFSREFVELVAAIEWRSIRAYTGATILFSSIPNVFGTVNPQFGVDMTVADIITSDISIVAGYDFKLTTIFDTITGVHAGEAGLKLGSPYGAGISIVGHFFHGKSAHGMFFAEQDSYAGIGFGIDL